MVIRWWLYNIYIPFVKKTLNAKKSMRCGSSSDIWWLLDGYERWWFFICWFVVSSRYITAGNQQPMGFVKHVEAANITSWRVETRPVCLQRTSWRRNGDSVLFYHLVMTHSLPWWRHGPNRNRWGKPWFTELNNEWIFHGELLNTQRVNSSSK